MVKVAVKKTNPKSVLHDYNDLMCLAEYQKYIIKEADSLIKLNLSWTKFFPACSTPPWELEGVLKTLIDDGFDRQKIFPVENKTVVTDPRQGAQNNKWLSVLKKYGVNFYPLTEEDWVNWQPQNKLLVLDKIFKEKGGLRVPKMFFGKQIIHLPTMKTHGHTTTTGAIKNAFGGLLQEIRHYAHKHIHEAMVDLLILQKEIHPSIFAVMDGTVAGNGAGPRTMEPEIKNFILASADSVAIDAVAAKMMGFEPLNIPYIRMCHNQGLGVGDIKQIDIVGEDIERVNFNFKMKKSFVIFGDQLIRKGRLNKFEKLLLHSPLVFWAPLASNIYHDFFWYPLIGRARIKKFLNSEWGNLFLNYE